MSKSKSKTSGMAEAKNEIESTEFGQSQWQVASVESSDSINDMVGSTSIVAEVDVGGMAEANNEVVSTELGQFQQELASVESSDSINDMVGTTSAVAEVDVAGIDDENTNIAKEFGQSQWQVASVESSDSINDMVGSTSAVAEVDVAGIDEENTNIANMQEKVKLQYDKDGWVCGNFPMYLPLAASVGSIEIDRVQYDKIWDVQEYHAWKVVDGKIVESKYMMLQDAAEVQQAIEFDQAECELYDIRYRREIECFSIINRGQLWYKGLAQEQLAELEAWYKAWLNATATKDIPDMPKWLKEGENKGETAQ